MLTKLSHVMIFAKNHEQTVKWYCDKLDFEIDYIAPGEYASLHHKTIGRLAIHVTDSDIHIGKGPMPYLLCNDIKATMKSLKELDIKVSEPQREGESPWFADFYDCEGNIWGVEEN